MKKFFLFVMVLAFALPAHANPFLEGKPSEAGAVGVNLMATPFLQEILSIQRQIHEAMTGSIEALKDGHSPDALMWLLLISFAYGVFHVLAPGHGKVIVASYFIGNHAHWREGIWAGLIMAIGHTVTAVGVVMVLYFILGLTQFHVLADARYMEMLGYGMITVIGLWLMLRSFKKNPVSGCAACGHDHSNHHSHDHVYIPVKKNRGGMSLFAATSLVPCTGSMIILLFTVANGVIWAGILAVLAIALGMWLTVTLIGLASMLLRRAILGKDEILSPFRRQMMQLVSIITAMLVTLTGGLLFAGTLYTTFA